MTIAKLAGAHAHNHAVQRRAPQATDKSLARAQVGDQVALRILDKIGDGRFIAAADDARYVVATSLRLNVGDTVKATVSSVGAIVELKYVGGGQFELKDAGAIAADASASTALVDKMQTRYRVSLSAPERHLLERASSDVKHPEAMTMGALYLHKLATPIDEQALQALYAKQAWASEDQQDAALAADVSALMGGIQQGREASITTLANLLADALEQSSATAVGSTQTPPTQDALAQALPTSSGQQLVNFNADANSSDEQSSAHLKELARRLLNLQDLGTVAYSYGSLPILIANQLVELDLVMFRERDSAARPQGLRKLVMTFKTDTLGQVEVVAQSLENALSISIATQSPEATERLAAQAQEVRDLVGRLGWNVENVAYRLTTSPARAADQLIRHVLNSGTLDAVV